MNIHTAPLNGTLVGHGDGHEEGHSETGKTPLGFWIYLMSDCILFASVFAGFIVVRGNLAGGPNGREIFELNYVAVENRFVADIEPDLWPGHDLGGQNKLKAVYGWLAITFLLGLGFIGMEINELPS